MDLIQTPSPNFDARGENITPSLLLLHYTGMKSGADALARMCDPAAKVSAHYMVEEDGTSYQLVEEDKRAWHAGRSFWRGEDDINAHSIGIEIVNPGHEHGYRPFPAAQIQAVGKLAREIMARWAIPAEYVLAHADVAPSRKEDPGELFPWAQLAADGVGLWPVPEAEDMDVAKAWDLDAYVGACRSYGYDPECSYEYVLRAFERHFAPELVLGTSQDDVTAKARLAWLLRQGGR